MFLLCEVKVVLMVFCCFIIKSASINKLTSYSTLLAVRPINVQVCSLRAAYDTSTCLKSHWCYLFNLHAQFSIQIDRLNYSPCLLLSHNSFTLRIPGRKPSQSWTNKVHFQMPWLLKGVMQKRALTNVWPLVTKTPTWAKLCTSYLSHSGSVRVDDRENVAHSRCQQVMQKFAPRWNDAFLPNDWAMSLTLSSLSKVG